MGDLVSGSWTPRNDRQQPPFEPGNEVSLHHGAYSPRRVDPLASAFVDRLLADPDVAYLRAAAYRPALWAWGRAEAQCQLLTEWIADNGGLAESLAETGEETSDETHEGNHTRRVSRSRRVGSALATLDRAEARASSCRSRLGLDPMSRARLGRDVAASQVDLATVLTQLREASEKEAQKPQGGPDDQ